MPETLHPGLYSEQVVAPPPVEAVATSVAAFVGTAIKGRLNESYLATSWNQFVAEYGSFTANSYLAYAVRAFFENGGSKAYISRVVHKTAGVDSAVKSTGNLISGDSTPGTLITVDAINAGTWGDLISVQITNFSYVDLTFDLKVLYNSAVVETYEDISLENIEGYINGYSKYITVNMLSENPTLVWLDEQTLNLTGGDDGLTGMTDTDYIGSSVTNSGLYAFDNVKVNIVAIPGITTQAVHQGIITYVDGRGDCFGILDSPLGKTPATIITYKNTEANLVSENNALYYPWVYASDPIGIGKSPKKLLPPSGFMAGVYARIDKSRGVWKAPGGTDCTILGALGLEYDVKNGEQDDLNPALINCIRNISGSGICAWSARTLKKGQYLYISTRRTNTFILSSLLSSLQWAVLEPNNENLWKRMRTKGNEFCQGIKDQNGIAGFFFACDDTINTSSVVNAGKLYADIGIANDDPAEFIILRMSLI